MQTDKSKDDSRLELDSSDSRDVAAIAFVILANQVARKTGVSQLEIQEEVLIEAFRLFKISSPEGLECFLAMNFPMMREVNDED